MSWKNQLELTSLTGYIFVCCISCLCALVLHTHSDTHSTALSLLTSLLLLLSALSPSLSLWLANDTIPDGSPTVVCVRVRAGQVWKRSFIFFFLWQRNQSSQHSCPSASSFPQSRLILMSCCTAQHWPVLSPTALFILAFLTYHSSAMVSSRTVIFSFLSLWSSHSPPTPSLACSLASCLLLHHCFLPSSPFPFCFSLFSPSLFLSPSLLLSTLSP